MDIRVFNWLRSVEAGAKCVPFEAHLAIFAMVQERYHWTFIGPTDLLGLVLPHENHPFGSIWLFFLSFFEPCHHVTMVAFVAKKMGKKSLRPLDHLPRTMRHQQDELMNLQSLLKRLQGLQAQLEQQLSVPWS